METTFLSARVCQRLVDLIKNRKLAQTDLAKKIRCSDSTLSRFINGKTDKFSDEYILRIARVFNMSTNFILGVITVPDRKNYEIDELELFTQTARNLYTGKVNTQLVNRLLESPRFAELTYILEQYFNDTIAFGFGVQNQLYATLANLTKSTVETDAGLQTAKDIHRLRTSVYQKDLATIENQFMAAVREVKKEIGNDFSMQQALTKETDKLIFEKLTKGQDMEKPQVTSEQIYMEWETLRELYEGLVRIGEQEQTYLLYRHSFTDDTEHTLIGTAIHFNLTKRRAKNVEECAMDNL